MNNHMLIDSFWPRIVELPRVVVGEEVVLRV
jgi:hypothetical protein